MILVFCGVTALTLFLPAQANARQSPEAYSRPDLLMEAVELARPEVAGKFHILDVRGKQKYSAGHIPSAVWVDQLTWSKSFRSGQDRDAWTKRIGELGIDIDTPVVIYDDTVTPTPARIWWILRYWGIQDVRLLNGGWPAWHAGSGKVSTDEAKYPARQPKLSSQTSRLATKDQVLKSLGTKQVQIIDARSKSEFCGLENTAKRNGAIPGAVHLEWIDVLDQKTQRFKSAGELAKLFQDRGIDLNRPAVTHCQSGGRAAVMAFALELMGAKDVRNYYKSWAEWGNADDTPIERPNK
jgi:thiosulfate/3-mercaptopyruvate sulfurtransferase